MGIKGLLPFLKSITRIISLSDIKGSIVAVDAYCWLHKSSISCSKNLVLGDDTDIYMKYCLKCLKLLLVYDIKVILVFDGKDLPAKQGVDQKRQELRETNKKKALQLLREDKSSEAKEYFDKSVQISHEIAVKFIKKAHSLGVKCIVAPYEADAQLAYLAINKLVDYVITEDSDLLAFGAPKVIFKLDPDGRGCLIDKMDLNKVLNLTPEKYSFDKFRFICILAGCDYFPGVNRIGLTTATAMMQKTQLSQLSEFLRRINLYTKKRIVVSDNDRLLAERAELTFRHQVVFDPVARRQRYLFEDGAVLRDMSFLGQPIQDNQLAMELALGMRHPTTGDLVPEFNEDQTIDAHTYKFYFARLKPAPKQGLARRQTIAATANKNKLVKVNCSFSWRSFSQSSGARDEIKDIIADYVTAAEATPTTNKKPTVSKPANEDVYTALLKMGVPLLNTDAPGNSSVPESGVVSAKAIVLASSKRPRQLTETWSEDDKENRPHSDLEIYREHKKPKVVVSSDNKEKPSFGMSKKQLIQATLPHLFKKKSNTD